MRTDNVRRGYEAAHPSARRAREEFETMAAKVNAFLDIPAKLPERKMTPAEKECYRRLRQTAALTEHVRWRSLMGRYQLQPAVYHDL